jgi:hypothetical protein
MNSANEEGNSEKRNPKQEEELSKVISKRNRRLAELFKTMELPVKIIGDEHMPVCLYDEKFILNCYVHNFELRFMSEPIGGECIYTIKLMEVPKFDKNRVLECINNYPVRYVSKVSLKNTNPKLYLTGYNYLNKEDGLGRYPVFSAYSPKIYFSEQKAKEIADELKNDGYDSAVDSENNINQ